MTAITELHTLLASVAPTIHPDTFVFITSETERPDISPIAIFLFREPEGVTYVIPLQTATHLGLHYSFPCRLITLMVNSSLNAIGFLAIVAQRLAAKEIPVNAVSAFHHDHLFVPPDRADDAVAELRALTKAPFGDPADRNKC